MADYSVADLKGALARAGFSGDGLDVMTAIGLAENTSRSLTAVNTAGNSPPSRDRGPLQINDFYHPDVGDACAFNLDCSAQAVYKISDGGTNFGPWATFKTGAYMNFLADARAALAGPSAPGTTATLTGVGPGGIIPTPSDAVSSLRKASLWAVFAAGGLGLVVAGAWHAATPVRRQVKAKGEEAGQTAAMAAAFA
ncbi:MAG: hypothetical protein JWP02_1508 [Acidimicrobiales bacterium]|nr:hypothetical protein [Acidimicrobiales bacterium]